MISLKQKFQNFICKKAKERIVNTPNGKQHLSVLTAKPSVLNGRIRPADFVVCHTDGTKRYPHAVFYTVPTSKIKETTASIRSFFNNNHFRNLEAFVFDYERKVWMSFKRSTNEGDRDDNYSYVLNSTLTDIVSGSGYCRTNYVVEKPVWKNYVPKGNYVGIGMAEPLDSHQDLVVRFYVFLNRRKKKLEKLIGKECKASQQIGLKAGSQGKAPDVILCPVFNHTVEDTKPYIMIEIDHNYRLSSVKEKFDYLMELYKPTDEDDDKSNKCLLEYFFYAYDTGVWYSFGPNANPERPSFSKLLGADLTNALKINVTKL